jgi:hypothetical protein
MVVLTILRVIAEIIVLLYLILSLFIAKRNERYQKLWRFKKSTIIRMEPDITRAKLCEQYVDFCKENNCEVDF